MQYNMATKFLRLRWIGLYLDYNYKISDAEEAFDGLDETLLHQLQQLGQPDNIDQYNKLLAAEIEKWMQNLMKESHATREELELDVATNLADFYNI